MKREIFIKFFIVLIVLFTVIFVLRFLSGEDNWICENGEWQKHGNPSAQIPTSGCGEKEIVSALPTTTIGNAGCNDFKNVNWSAKQLITSPLKLTGEVRGNWFFEASFPVFLVNWDGLIIAQGIAQSKSDPANPYGEVNWMTTDFVPFEVNLEFIKPDYKNNGAIILKKDNPSGLPQNDASCELPILFE